MTIDDSIRMLEQLKAKHGGATVVYFDCPACKQSFTPATIVGVAVHMTQPKGT